MANSGAWSNYRAALDAGSVFGYISGIIGLAGVSAGRSARPAPDPRDKALDAGRRAANIRGNVGP